MEDNDKDDNNFRDISDLGLNRDLEFSRGHQTKSTLTIPNQSKPNSRILTQTRADSRSFAQIHTNSRKFALQETWASGAAEGVGGFPVGCRFGYFLLEIWSFKSCRWGFGVLKSGDWSGLAGVDGDFGHPILETGEKGMKF